MEQRSRSQARPSEGGTARLSALAALRSGCSYAQAAQVSGLSLPEVEKVWRKSSPTKPQ
jgi:hypothetical protein